MQVIFKVSKKKRKAVKATLCEREGSADKSAFGGPQPPG
jgi:hypothetical protein